MLAARIWASAYAPTGHSALFGVTLLDSFNADPYGKISRAPDRQPGITTPGAASSMNASSMIRFFSIGTPIAAPSP